MPVFSRSSGLVSTSLPTPPGNRVANRLVKCVLTSANAAENTVWISRSTALITRMRSRRVLRTSSSCSSRKRCRSCSSLNSSSASGLIGPIRRSSRSRSRTRAGGVDALGHPRQLGGLGGLGLEVVVAAQRLDRAFEAHAHLGLVDLDATHALARLVELLLGGATGDGATSSRRSAMPRTSSLWRRRISSSSLWRTSTTWRCPSTSAASRSTATRLRSTAIAALCRLGTRGRVGLQAALGLLQPTLEERLPLVQAGVAHFEVLPPAGQPRRLGVEPGAGFAAGLARPRPRRPRRPPARAPASRARRCGCARARCVPRHRPSARSTVSISACASRRSACARASASLLAEKPASCASSRRVSSFSCWRAACSSALRAGERRVATGQLGRRRAPTAPAPRRARPPWHRRRRHRCASRSDRSGRRRR